MQSTTYSDSLPNSSADAQRQARRFGLRFSERKLLLIAGDLSALAAALLLALLLRAGGYLASPAQALPAAVDYLGWLLVLAVTWAVVGQIFDIYNLTRAARRLHSTWLALGAGLITALLYLFIPYVSAPLPERRLHLLLFPLLTAGAVATWRLVYTTVFSQPMFTHRALVVGGGWAGLTLAETIHQYGGKIAGSPLGSGYRILGFIDDDPDKLHRSVAGVPVLGTRHDLLRLVRLLRPDEIILAITDLNSIHGELFQLVLKCREIGITLTPMPDLYERLTGRVPVEHAGRDLHVVLPLERAGTHRAYVLLWRLVELAVALLGTLFLLLLVPLVWLANRFSSPGPLFYRQERVGQGGQTFQVVKFRSMVPDAEANTGAVWAGAGDSRITPVGCLLRKTRLDEVPQFWNVLKGEMGLIGPRPERPCFVSELEQKLPFYGIRHSIRPGVTGWAQVNYNYGASVEDALVKLQYDLYYLKHHGAYLDLKIMLRTAQVMLGLKGR